MLVKASAIYVIARVLKSSHAVALERAVLMGQGGEFAFVLYTTAATAGLIDAPTNAIFTATVIISMVLTPFFIIGLRYVLPKDSAQSMEGVEKADGLSGKILIIGFGRFGQIASQPLLAMHHSVSIIDNDAEMVRVAAQIGFKVYYGDGTRLDILHAAGAGTADVILICTDKKEQTTRIAELLRDEFPLVRVMARAFDRGHAIELIKMGVEYQLREMFESALTFGGEVIRLLGATDEEAAEVVEGVRDRDQQRFEMQLAGADQLAGSRLLLSNARDQAREGGVVLSEKAVEDTIAKSTQPAS
jgi:glutathione-regulated potassium-efflux system protein KefB